MSLYTFPDLVVAVKLRALMVTPTKRGLHIPLGQQDAGKNVHQHA